MDNKSQKSISLQFLQGAHPHNKNKKSGSHQKQNLLQLVGLQNCFLFFQNDKNQAPISDHTHKKNLYIYICSVVENNHQKLNNTPI